MYKLCLTLFSLFVGSNLLAQTSSIISPAPSSGFGAVTIAVSKDHAADGDSYFYEADRLEKIGKMNEALTLFGKAAFEYNTVKDFNAFGNALLRLSNVHLLMNHYKEAEQVILNVALKNYSRIGNKRGQMESYHQLGKVYYASDRLTQSLWFYTQQGILAKQLKNHPAYLDSMLGVIFVKIKKKQYSMALKDVGNAESFATASKISDYNTQFVYTRSVIDEKANQKK